MGYILHRGDEKDPGPDQFLNFETWGYEVWQLQGADPEEPYILPILGEPGPMLGLKKGGACLLRFCCLFRLFSVVFHPFALMTLSL